MLLTVKDRMEEKRVPSSYLESLERRPWRTVENCRHQREQKWEGLLRSPDRK